MKQFSLLLVLFYSAKIDLPLHPFHRFTIWNVGQGSWATLITREACFHFDMGGETSPLQNVLAECKKRKNRLYFSHWDWDHISFVQSLRSRLPHACLAEPPGGPAPKKRKTIFNGLSKCENSSLVEKIDFTPPQKASANDRSKIFIVAKAILITGDSSVKMEKIWFKQIQDPGRIKYLLLGHHGSRTSTSNELLNNLKGLKQAVTSARQSKYGHPHPTVLARLQEFAIPQLRTEDWGHLHFNLESEN